MPSCSVTVFWQQGLKLDNDQATQFTDDSGVCLLSAEAFLIVTKRYKPQAKLLLGMLMSLVCGLQSYRKLAKEYHPDKNPDAGDKVWVTKTPSFMYSYNWVLRGDPHHFSFFFQWGKYFSKKYVQDQLNYLSLSSLFDRNDYQQ